MGNFFKISAFLALSESKLYISIENCLSSVGFAARYVNRLTVVSLTTMAD